MSKLDVKSITCTAAVCWGANEPSVIEEIEVQPPKSSEIRIKMLCASLCHTDILYWHGFKSLGPVVFPRVLGHEGVGVVESIGEGVTEVEEGDVVIPTYIGECRECEACKSGKTNLCQKYMLYLSGLMPDDTSRMTVKGQTLYQLWSCSTWTQYTVVNVNYVVKVDPRVAPMHASLLSCGFSTGFGAVWKEAKVEKGSTVAVFGLGAVGLGVACGARMMGAKRIIGLDLNEKKKEKGEIMGITDFVNPGEVERSKSVVDIIREMTGGLGVDYSFECTGVSSVVNQAFDAAAMGAGMTVLIGAGHEENVTVSLMGLLLGKTLKGCVFGGIKPRSDLPILVDKCINKELQLDPVVTHEVELEDIQHAFELLKQPECLKVVIWVEKSCKNWPTT